MKPVRPELVIVRDAERILRERYPFSARVAAVMREVRLLAWCHHDAEQLADDAEQYYDKGWREPRGENVEGHRPPAKPHPERRTGRRKVKSRKRRRG